MRHRVQNPRVSTVPFARGLTRRATVVALASLAAFACGDGGTDNLAPIIMPRVDSTTVASADVVPRLAAARTYEHLYHWAQPDSVLTALWTAGLEVEEAWRALNDLCLDARGPRLTVALKRPADARMADNDFQLGTGRLECSPQLRQYAIGMPPGSFRVDGTVGFVQIEGGCWVLRVNETRYEALGLPLAFRVDGLEVRALLTLRDDLASTCMVGRIAEVLEIERR